MRLVHLDQVGEEMDDGMAFSGDHARRVDVDMSVAGSPRAARQRMADLDHDSGMMELQLGADAVAGAPIGSFALLLAHRQKRMRTKACLIVTSSSMFISQRE